MWAHFIFHVSCYLNVPKKTIENYYTIHSLYVKFWYAYESICHTFLQIIQIKVKKSYKNISHNSFIFVF